MKRLYSKTTETCYLVGFHQDIPEDAREISEERFIEVIGNPDPAKVRGHDDEGLPILIDPPPLSAEELADNERIWRDTQLSVVQWLRDRHRDELDLPRETTLSTEQFAELLDYMQQLRDWPQSDRFPDPDYRPDPPGWTFQ